MRRAAFTLLELLVVLAVVALLLGILVPAMAGARRASLSAKCVSNLRQIARASNGYGLEYGAFPPAILYWQRDGSVVIEAWDWVTTMSGDLVSPGRIWSFTDDPGRVQQCPACRCGTNFADPHTGYNYNTSFVGGEGWFVPGQWGWATYRPGIRPSACRRPAEVAAFGDGAIIGTAGNVANKFMRAPLNMIEHDLPMVYGGAQAFRHGKATNAAFLDLHVESIATPHRGALATDALAEQMGFPASGFLSDDDRAYDPR